MSIKTWKPERYEVPDTLSFTAHLDDKGRIVIPASVRSQFCLSFGSKVLATVKKDKGGDKSEEM